MRALQLTGAFIGWVSLVLLYATIYVPPDEGRVAATTVSFFSYFTVLSNIMVALAFSFPHTFHQPALRGAVALYITITCLIYFLLLRNAWEPRGIQWFTDITLHYILPPLYLFDWWRGPHRAQLRWRHAIYWLSFPLLFALYTLAHGAVSGFYPYYFLNAAQFGYARVLLNMGVLTCVFLIVGVVLISVDRKQRG